MALPRSLLLVVGDELLGGFTVDRNGPLALRLLHEAGYPARRLEIVSDSVDDIAAAVRRGIDDPSIARIIVCGGIGPTPDDRTHEAVARALGRDLVEHPEALRHVRELVARMHAAGWVASPEPSPANRRMARMAAGGQVLTNRRGMAPPLAVRLDGDGAERWLFVLPGVPREFEAILEEELIPEFFTGSRPLTVIEQQHPGAVEADFAEPLRQLEIEFPDVAAGSYPQQQRPEPLLVIRLRGEDPDQVAAAAARLTALREEAQETG
ncbi:MAG TPA: molybdopterin-binding protein [Candidatus Binatia bacterium]|nr:molybdopterin-binding protein [Candidatus Binatia bacterium]